MRAQDPGRREDILFAARELFARHGFAKVSLRDIAAEARMSVGNLTYYFPRKTDLIEAVLADLSADSFPGERAPRDLRTLRLFLFRCEQDLSDKAFFFRPGASPDEDVQLASFQLQAIRALGTLWDGILQGLVEEELLEPPAYPDQYRAVSTVIQLLFRHWGVFSRTKKLESPGFQDCVWAVLYPYLTEKGRQDTNRGAYGKKQAI